MLNKKNGVIVILSVLLAMATLCAILLPITVDKINKERWTVIQPTPSVVYNYEIATIYSQDENKTVFEDEDGSLWGICGGQEYSADDKFMLIFNEDYEIIEIWVQG